MRSVSYAWAGRCERAGVWVVRSALVRGIPHVDPLGAMPGCLDFGSGRGSSVTGRAG